MGQAREKGKFGLRIRSYQAGSVYSYSLGVRDNYDFKDAMLTNSMFLNFMKENGLKVRHEDSTRDIICLDFGYGSRSYEEEIKHLNKILRTIKKDQKLDEEKRQQRIDSVNRRIEEANNNKDKFDKKRADQIRTKFYNYGVDIEYYYTNKKGIRVLDETIHYKMLYRTPGKAKTGKCQFCREELYDVAHNYLTMGVELPEENAPVIEMGAYSSLITSTIDINIGDQGRIKIAPEEILILKDVDSFVNTRIISVETNENKHCIAKEIEDYPVMNEMFDGQALIDSSIFPKEGNGYILLRQHFTKCAAFCTHIQKYFKDYYGDAYEDVYITDMFGRDVKASDVKLITTNNAVKWLKFGVTFDYWADWIRKSDNYWGIVKTAHKSKFGDVQRMSYQMVNALNMDTMDQVCKRTLDYIQELKANDEVFLQYLKDNQNYSNDFEVLLALYDQDNDFIKCDYFKERRLHIIEAYILNFKTGKVIQDAENLVIVGSPYAMLMHTVGEDPLQDPTFDVEDCAMQCWTSRFKDGEYLAEFRSPFNSQNGLGYLHNVHNDLFDKYFDLGELCIAVNMNHTVFQPRNNGADQDSDSIYVTNFPAIVDHAKYCQVNYSTVVNNIPQEKNIYDNSMDSFAAVDNKLAGSQLNIGFSSNLAQISLSYCHSFPDKKYLDATCILAVLAQISIDSAKKSYDMDLAEEINRLKEAIDIDKNKYPEFWKGIRRGFNKNRINKNLVCPMNYLYRLKIKEAPHTPTLPMSMFFQNFKLAHNDKRKRGKKIEDIINEYSLTVYQTIQTKVESSEDRRERHILLRDDFDKLIDDLKSLTYISKNYKGFMCWLLNRAFIITPSLKSNKNVLKNKFYKNRVTLLRILYELNPECLLECFSKNIEK